MSEPNQRYLTRFPIIEYPKTLYRIKINDPLTYTQVNEALKTCKNVTFHYHEKTLYIVGDPEVVIEKLRNTGTSFSKEDPIEVDLERDFPVLRIILYKAFRSFLKRKGFVWKPEKKTSAFVSHIADDEQNLLSQLYGIRMVRRLTASVGTELYIHEGFDYIIEKKGQSLFLTLLLKVTPLIKTDLGQVRPGTKMVTACHKECELKGTICTLPLWKSIIVSAEAAQTSPGWCPYAQAWVRLIDIKGKELVVPAHTLNIESNPHQIRRLNLYEQFRRFSLKNDFFKTKTLKALLSYLTSGRKHLWVKVGKDIGAMKVDVTLREVQVEEVPNAWEAYSLA
jgi:hypothetical protein